MNPGSSIPSFPGSLGGGGGGGDASAQAAQPAFASPYIFDSVIHFFTQSFAGAFGKELGALLLPLVGGLVLVAVVLQCTCKLYERFPVFSGGDAEVIDYPDEEEKVHLAVDMKRVGPLGALDESLEEYADVDDEELHDHAVHIQQAATSGTSGEFRPHEEPEEELI